MRATKITLLILALTVTAAACGDDGVEQDWEEEILLQLFKAKEATLGGLFVEATTMTSGVPASPVKLKVNDDGKFFDDCEGNKVRVLPRKVGGAYPDVKIRITSLVPVSPKVYAEQILKVPAAGVVKLVLVKGKEVLPLGCAPTVKLTGLGLTCGKDDDCEHGKCLKKITDGSGTYTFNNGTCAKDCTKGESCPSGVDAANNPWSSECVEFGYVGQPSPPSYCIKKCKGNGDCRVDGYSCTGGSVCLPEVVK